MPIKHYTTYYWNDLEAPFNPENAPEFTYEKDGVVVAAFLVQDDCAEDPFNGDEGEFYQFNWSNIHDCEKPDLEDWRRIIRRHPGRVFTHDGTDDCHGPGTVSCHVLEGPLTIKDTRNTKRRVPGTGSRVFPDCSSFAERCLNDAQGYYIVPEDVPEDQRRKYAEAMLESYSAWCNGEVYGVCVWKWINGEFQEDSRESECWGFIGYEYAKEELERLFKEEITKHE